MISYRAGNAEFAAGAWQDDWPDPPSTRTVDRLALAAQSPALVADVMSTIQRVIDKA